MIIRTLLPSDHAAAFALWRSCPGIQLREEDGCAGRRRYLQRNPGLSLAGELDGGLIATLMVGHDGRRGYLQHLAVAASQRGQGYGRRLLDEAGRRPLEQGIGKAHVFVLQDAGDAMSYWAGLHAWQRRDDIQVYSSSVREEALEARESLDARGQAK